MLFSSFFGPSVGNYQQTSFLANIFWRTIYGQTLGGDVSVVVSKWFQQPGETTRNRYSEEEKKEMEGFYACHKAAKQRLGKFYLSVRLNSLSTNF